MFSLSEMKMAGEDGRFEDIYFPKAKMRIEVERLARSRALLK